MDVTPTTHLDRRPPVVPPPPKRPGVWSGLGIVVLYFLLQFAIGIVVGAAIWIVLAVRTSILALSHHPMPDLPAITHTVRTNPDIRVVVAITTIAAATLVIVVLVRRLWPAQWSRADLPGFGIVQPPQKLAYVAAVALGLLVLGVGGAMTHLLAAGHPIHQDVTVLAGEVPTSLRICLAVLVVCVAPVVEELAFRGVLLSGLASKLGTGWAVVATAILFGCAHLPDFGLAWYPVPALILMGLVLAWLRIRTHSLWPSITLHATNNFVAMLGWFLIAHH